MLEGPMPDCAAVLAALEAPLRVGVTGRAGAGCRSVRRALEAAGTVVTDGTAGAEVLVYVFVETPTAEDEAALRELAAGAAGVVAVLNKADLSGFRGDGPMAAAQRRCGVLRSRLGIPVLPLAAPAAIAGCRGAVGDETAVGLRALAVDPGRLGPGLRRHLLIELDLYGLAVALHWLRGGRSPSGIAGALRDASGIDGLLAAIDERGAPARRRRLASVRAALTTAALRPGGAGADELLRGATMVRARAAARRESP